MKNLDEKLKTIREEFNEMNRKCAEEYGFGQFPPEVWNFMERTIRRLLEEQAREIIGEDTRHATDTDGEVIKIYASNIGHVSMDEIINEMQKDIDAQNRLRAEQRIRAGLSQPATRHGKEEKI